MNISKFFSVIALSAACLLPAAAQQETPSALSLSLEEAQTYAIEHNRTLKNASLDIRKAQASKWQSIASMLPQINATATYSKSFDKDFHDYSLDFSGAKIVMPSTGNLNIQMSVAVSGSQVVATKLGEIALQMSDITFRQSEQQTRDQVKTLYYSALVVERTIGLLEANLENMQKMYQQTLKAAEVGVSEQTDADQLLVQVATMQTTLNSKKITHEMTINSLRLQLGVAADVPLQLSQSLDDLMNIDIVATLLGEEFDPECNYDFQLLRKNTELSKEQLTSAKWSCSPTLSAYYQFSQLTHFGASGGFDMNAPHSVGATLSIPIFSSLSKTKSVQSARFEYEKQLNNMEQTEESLRIQHSQLRYALATAYETYQTQLQNLDVTQRIFDKMSSKYAHGAASSLELTTAGNDLISAQSTYVQALLSLVTAQIQLEELLNR